MVICGFFIFTQDKTQIWTYAKEKSKAIYIIDISRYFQIECDSTIVGGIHSALLLGVEYG
jgi:hypothetical protein